VTLYYIIHKHNERTDAQTHYRPNITLYM